MQTPRNTIGDITTRFCDVCDAQTTMKCSGCSVFHYCTREHQKEHWPTHKKFCKHLKPISLPPSTVPYTFHEYFTVSAILFPAAEAAPRLVKAVFTVEEDDEGRLDRWHLLQRSQHGLGERRGGYPVQYSNGYNGPILPVEHCMHIYWRDMFLSDGSPPNQSIINATDQTTDALHGGFIPHQWSGNILAVKTHTTRETVTDATLHDLPAVVKYLINYGRPQQ